MQLPRNWSVQPASLCSTCVSQCSFLLSRPAPPGLFFIASDHAKVTELVNFDGKPCSEQRPHNIDSSMLGSLQENDTHDQNTNHALTAWFPFEPSICDLLPSTLSSLILFQIKFLFIAYLKIPGTFFKNQKMQKHTLTAYFFFKSASLYSQIKHDCNCIHFEIFQQTARVGLAQVVSPCARSQGIYKCPGSHFIPSFPAKREQVVIY